MRKKQLIGLGVGGAHNLAAQAGEAQYQPKASNFYVTAITLQPKKSADVQEPAQLRKVLRKQINNYRSSLGPLATTR